MMWDQLKHRSDQQELMDDLNCSGVQVEQTLKELATINRLLGGNGITLHGLGSLFSMAGGRSEDPLEIADLGCGGGDMLVLMAQWARKASIRVRLVGIDANPNIIQYAQRNCREYPEIEFKVLDIFSPEFKSSRYDIIACSLFTHHFQSDQLVVLLSSLKEQSRLGVVINDLHRHWLAYWSIKILTRLLSRSILIKNDAPISVLRGFKRQELKGILLGSGIHNYQLKWKWAFRWQLIFRT